MAPCKRPELSQPLERAALLAFLSRQGVPMTREESWIAATLAAIAALGSMPLAAAGPTAALPEPVKSGRTEPRFIAPPDLRELAARLGGGISPTPEQRAEQRRIECEQVAHALQWLRSASAEERIAAVEQLSAYPARQSERVLVGVLAEDQSPEVRSAAAQALSQVQEPARETFQALLRAMRHPDEEVRRGALGTLELHLSRSDKGAARFKQIILADLRKLAASPNTDRQTREAIRALLAED